MSVRRALAGAMALSLAVPAATLADAVPTSPSGGAGEIRGWEPAALLLPGMAGLLIVLGVVTWWKVPGARRFLAALPGALVALLGLAVVIASAFFSDWTGGQRIAWQGVAVGVVLLAAGAVAVVRLTRRTGRPVDEPSGTPQSGAPD